MTSTVINKQPKPLASYYGGKSKSYGAKIAHMVEATPHRIYFEPFAGMAGVLMQKKSSEVELINDLHDGVVNLFRVVRNPETCEQLVNALRLTPCARSEWDYCEDSWQTQTDPVEKARQLYVVLQQNFVGRTHSGSWSFGGVKHRGNVAQRFVNSIENIRAVCERLQGVLIENQDALGLMERWDSVDTVMFLDPPYPLASRYRNEQCYEHELSDTQHVTLLNLCIRLKSKIFLASYPNNLYSEILALAGWRCISSTALATSAMATSGNGLKGKSAGAGKRVECLWLNPAAQAAQIQLEMFSENGGGSNQVKLCQNKLFQTIQALSALSGILLPLTSV
jgi:DNA adenine methylase